MKKLLILLIVSLVGCTVGPQRQDYQMAMSEEVESPFFYIPALNQKDFADRTWILLAESRSKIWFYDPYTLSEDEEGIVAFDAFFSPREKNALAPYNATIVGPYRQKIDCFGNHQWSETLYTQNIISKAPIVGDTKPVNGSGWVKIAPRTAMAYMRSRLCGRKFIDDQNINYFLHQESSLPAPVAKKAPVEVFDEKLNKQVALSKEDVVIESTDAKPPVFYEVINNEVTVVDAKKGIRQLRLSSYLLNKDFPKQADYVFTANCQGNSYSITPQVSGEKSSSIVGVKDSLVAVAFNRACGDHGVYMKLSSKGGR
ncbi:hypothetical protein [Polynucleobacter sp. AP-Reno-20A-A9]|uniref:hypothetical protein n=1 Tax=Polynucleobacter sp. AP-Reno-20A-A9 TaxID=2576925 RepID=UPI001C0D724C|nr:hypothetical protein [Polynucleobacter sp. AP-Reno-20A-A9]MBU3629332.1 hypothetical protein [Polynucleobacter sp. AP-Reno-20A-A9]